MAKPAAEALSVGYALCCLGDDQGTTGCLTKPGQTAKARSGNFRITSSMTGTHSWTVLQRHQMTPRPTSTAGRGVDSRDFPLNGELLRNCFAHLLALAAFLGTRLHVLIIRERFARLGTMVATLRTAIGHHCGKRPATRTDLGTGGTAGCTVPTVHQARQVFLLAIGQQVRTVRGTEVARTLTVGAGFGTLLQLLIGLHFRSLGLIGKHIHADDGEGESHRHHTDSTEQSIHHGNSPLLKPPLDAGHRNCDLASSDRLGPLENEKSRRVRTP